MHRATEQLNDQRKDCPASFQVTFQKGSEGVINIDFCLGTIVIRQINPDWCCLGKRDSGVFKLDRLPDDVLVW
jgi:hypothetical protein